MGICGGYQMLGREIVDGIESASERVDGLGLLTVRTEFAARKVLARPSARLANGTTVTGYQIHHGVVTREAGEGLVGDEGCVVGAVSGTTWHGLFENDEWRRTFLTELARARGKRVVVSPSTCFEDRREARIEALADLVDEHLDVGALLTLVERGVSGRRPARVQLALDAPQPTPSERQ